MWFIPDNWRILVLPVVFAWAGTGLVYGQLSMEQAVRHALEHHPQLAVARSDIAVAQGRLIEAGRLDNPELEFAVGSQAKDGSDREGSIFVGYHQKFPVTGKLLLQRDLGKADVHLASAEILEVERRIIAEVQRAYIDAVGARELAAELRQIERELEKSVQLAKSSVAAAIGSELDVSAAKTERLLVAQDRSRAEGDYRQAIARLRPLLHLAEGSVEVSDSLEQVIAAIQPTVGDASAEGVDRADITAAQLRQRRAAVDHQLAQSEVLEDWELSLGYEATRSHDEPVGAERDRILSLGMRVPIPVRKQGESRVAVAKARSEQAGHQLEALRAETLGDIGVQRVAVRNADASVKILRQEVLPELAKREQQTLDAYNQGLVDFSRIILLQQQQAKIKRQLTEAQLQKALALSRLQHAMGSHPLQSRYDSAAVAIAPPAQAPWAPPVLEEKPVARAIQAMPVVAEEGRGALRNWGKKLLKGKKSRSQTSKTR